MRKVNVEHIDLGTLRDELENHENQWLAVSEDNKVVGSGRTYRDAVEAAHGREDVVLFRVPPLDASLAQQSA